MREWNGEEKNGTILIYIREKIYET